METQNIYKIGGTPVEDENNNAPKTNEYDKIEKFEQQIKKKGKEGKQNKAKKQQARTTKQPLALIPSTKKDPLALLTNKTKGSKKEQETKKNITEGIKKMEERINVTEFVKKTLNKRDPFGITFFKNIMIQLKYFETIVEDMKRSADLESTFGYKISMEAILKGTIILKYNISGKASNGYTNKENLFEKLYLTLLTKESGIIEQINASLKGGVGEKNKEENVFFLNEENGENATINEEEVNISKINIDAIPQNIMDNIELITTKLKKYLEFYTNVNLFLEKRNKKNTNLEEIIKKINLIISKLEDLKTFVKDNQKGYEAELLKERVGISKKVNKISNKKPSNKKPSNKKPLQTKKELTNEEKEEKLSELKEGIVSKLISKGEISVPAVGRKGLQKAFNSFLSINLKKDVAVVKTFDPYKDLLTTINEYILEIDDEKNVSSKEEKVKKLITELNNKLDISKKIEENKKLLNSNYKTQENKYVIFLYLIKMFIKFFNNLLPKNKQKPVIDISTTFKKNFTSTNKKTSDIKYELARIERQLKYFEKKGLTYENIETFINQFTDLGKVNDLFTENYKLLEKLIPEGKRSTLMKYYEIKGNTEEGNAEEGNTEEGNVNEGNAEEGTRRGKGKFNFKKIVLYLHEDKLQEFNAEEKLLAITLFKALTTYMETKNKAIVINEAGGSSGLLVKYLVNLYEKKDQLIGVKINRAALKDNKRTLKLLDKQRNNIVKQITTAKEQVKMITNAPRTSEQSAGSHQLRTIQEKFSLFHANVSKYLQNKNGKAPTTAQVNREIAKRVKPRNR
jgi:hypothetical protein